MKKQFIIIAIIFIQFVSYGQTNKHDSTKISFYQAYDALKSMLEGKDSLNYEKAVFLTENAYHNNYFNYTEFKHLIDFHVFMINAYAENVRAVYKEKYKGLRRFEQQMFRFNTTNWAIFKYITDTAFLTINQKKYYKEPYTYTYQDPYGSNKWENTQVLFLLKSNEKQGNCYSLAVLFKLFSDRLKSDARLTITPHHIYIQNRNGRGDFNNVELASKTFPGDGTIQTLTYTTNTSIMKGMAQRMLNDKQAVALNLIYLAKSYQHKYNDNTSDFLLQCADLAFKYDTLSLNALLLKAEITENRLLASMKENKIIKLTNARTNPQTQKLLVSYERQLSDLYIIGYREIPKDIERIILANMQKRNEGAILNDKTPNPFVSIKIKQRYATLSNGMFDELHEAVDSIQYYHALLNTKTKKILQLLPIETSDDYKVDPVVFALSVDPMSDKYPNVSPYAYCAWNPVMLVDPNGMSAGWVKNDEGNVFWDNNTNSQGEFDKNYAGKQGYSYASDADNPKSYTLPSGEGKLVMNTWVAPNNTQNGAGGLQINLSFKPTDKSAEVGWTQTYSSNITDVNSGNLYGVLPEETIGERLDGYGVQESTDVSRARYFDGYTGYGTPNATLDDGPQRNKNPGAQWDVTFNAQSTVLINGKRTVSLGWGFTVNSETYQTIHTPMILQNTTEFHNNAVNSLIKKILSR